MLEITYKIRYFKLSKILKKFNFIFFLNPVSFNGQSYQKENGNGTSGQLISR